MILPARVTDLVWVQTGFLGDIILTTAAIKLASEQLPGVHQHLITTRLGAAALADFPFLQSRIAFDKSSSGSAAAFRSVKAELNAAINRSSAKGAAVTLLAHRSFRSSLLAAYLGQPRIAYNEADLSWLATERVPRVAVMHEAHRIGLLLEPLGVKREKVVASKPHLERALLLTDVPWQAALQTLPKPWIGIAPGSVWGTKRWTLEGFTELAKELLTSCNGSLVLIGSSKERPLTEAMMNALSVHLGPKAKDRCANIAGLSDLDDLRRVVPQLSVLTANDSSLVHYASAFNVPTVALFGSTVPEMGFGPLARHSTALGMPIECRPCSDHGPDVCPLGHFRCMRTLPVELVRTAVKKIMSV